MVQNKVGDNGIARHDFEHFERCNSKSQTQIKPAEITSESAQQTSNWWAGSNKATG